MAALRRAMKTPAMVERCILGIGLGLRLMSLRRLACEEGEDAVKWEQDGEGRLTRVVGLGG